MAEAVSETADVINGMEGDTQALAFAGNVTEEAFRVQVYDTLQEKFGPVNVCVPAAGITRDKLAIKVDKETGAPSLYSVDLFRLVTEVNLIAPTYWALEMAARIAAERKKAGKKMWQPEEEIQGVAVFIGSISSQGNRGQTFSGRQKIQYRKNAGNAP